MAKITIDDRFLNIAPGRTPAGEPKLLLSDGESAVAFVSYPSTVMQHAHTIADAGQNALMTLDAFLLDYEKKIETLKGGHDRLVRIRAAMKELRRALQVAKRIASEITD